MRLWNAARRPLCFDDDPLWNQVCGNSKNKHKFITQLITS